jgi:hypothetical protein
MLSLLTHVSRCRANKVKTIFVGRLDIHIVEMLKFKVFWNITPRLLVNSYMRFGCAYCAIFRLLWLFLRENESTTLHRNMGNQVKMRTEDFIQQELYYDGVRCNYHYCYSEYNLPFINLFQNMGWFVFI